eukprot:TRINITY_DN56178_c0_g1_i1.p1 TRINITY_DN56178_c0_g1~~TRINITY_DN56178_c0_g1_i1.p1  ORF type:complete len:128 (+),score=6.60 TRINITY_DN56178_c0_g1_i1:97-480(+)
MFTTGPSRTRTTSNNRSHNSGPPSGSGAPNNPPILDHRSPHLLPMREASLQHTSRLLPQLPEQRHEYYNLTNNDNSTPNSSSNGGKGKQPEDGVAHGPPNNQSRFPSIASPLATEEWTNLMFHRTTF